jgi:hypothetical protein
MSKLSKKNRRLRKPKSAAGAAGAADAAGSAGEGLGKASGIFGLLTSAAGIAMNLKKKKKKKPFKYETVGFKP